MKKLFLGILAIVIVLSVGMMNVVAANFGVRPNFAAIDGDNVFDTHNDQCHYAEEEELVLTDDCDSVYENCPEVGESELPYVENEGVFDNTVCPDQGCDWKNNGQNCDNGNFVDADNDGVCDNAATDRDYGCDWENGSYHHRKQLNANGNNGNYAAGQGKGCGRGSHHR